MNAGLQCVCCMTTEDLVELFGEANSEDGNYAEKLQFSLNIEINSEKYNLICQSCAGKLDECVTFKKQILDNLTLVESLVEIQQSDNEKLEIMYVDSVNDDFDGDIKTEYYNSELYKAMVTESNGNNYIKLIIKNVKSSVQEDNKEDHIATKIKDEHLDESSTIEIQKSDKEIEQIMHIDNENGFDNDSKTEYHNAELYKALVKESNGNYCTKTIVNNVNGSVQEDNKHDYICTKIKDKHLNEFCAKAFKPKRLNVMDAMPYTIDESERVCRECDEGFPSYGSLKIHYKTHFGQHICKVCNKRYMTAGSLSKHKSTHKTGPFYCSLCGQEFRYINSLNSHKQLKHRSLPFKCRHCLESFPTYTQRLTHEVNVHKQDEKKHKCPHCNTRFISAILKFHHIYNVHQISIVTCNLCGANFRKNYIKRHMFKKHNIGMGWQCSVCPARRPNKADLKKHMLIHSDTPRYVCKLCNKGFSQRCSLKYHIDKHVARQEFNGDPEEITICKYQAGDLNMGEVTRCEDISLTSKDTVELSEQFIDQYDDEQVVEEVVGEEIIDEGLDVEYVPYSQ